MEKKSLAAASELEEKQQLIHSIKKLELQVQSVQAEVKLEQTKTQEEKWVLFDFILYFDDVLSMRKGNPRELGQRGTESEIR